MDERYRSEQIITYLGNKRSLLDEIEKDVLIVKEELGKEKIITCDLFSGSGVVARMLKPHSSLLIANDLEQYSRVLNDCFLSNKSDFDEEIFENTLSLIEKSVAENPVEGIISRNYSPKDDQNILSGERVFYTNENARLIDSYRFYIDRFAPENYKKYFLARLLVEASIHVNTSGVFKGFYKDKATGIGKFGGTGENALTRIKGRINITPPVLSNYECPFVLYQRDANILAKELSGIDLVYLDPPYNQHPYGSNYFMLNLILKNEMPAEVSKVSGIPKDWNKSDYNKKSTALQSFEQLISDINARYIVISYNNEGFISFDEMSAMLKKYGSLRVKNIKYNTFRGSRNLRERDLYTNEYLFLLEKNKEEEINVKKDYQTEQNIPVTERNALSV